MPNACTGLQTVACVPMTSRGALIGALWAGRTPGNPAGEITADELRLLESIAEVAGNALQRAALHEQTEQRLRRLSALRAVDMAISASIDLRVTLSVLLDQVTTQLGVDAAAIRLLNIHSQSLTYLSGRGIQSPVIMQTPLQLGQGYAGTAALEHRVVSVSAVGRNRIMPTPGCCGKATTGSHRYFVTPLLAKGRIKGVLELFHRSAFQADEEWMEYLETMATQAAIAIDNASMFEDVQKTNTDLVAAYDATIEGWSRALELRDRETQGHTLRVTDIAIRLARMMGMKEEELVHVRRGALLHDIGKMAISDTILLKPDPLTAEEMGIMRQHPVFAYEMLHPDRATCGRPSTFPTATTRNGTAAGIRADWKRITFRSRPGCSPSSTSGTRCGRTGRTAPPGRRKKCGSISAIKAESISTRPWWMPFSTSSTRKPRDPG